ncbi:hypothetical protein BP6252_10912 [Coleophoma cylindrospora]|uniref:Heterokaryon incompatibility domain-containing protein n=1 Tax=Coleophoma cylindrospora TaxID=1849047 RepID=A0A3D8QNK1_9HELO|nr:hypothetical protein BP6252_10912 [Coleophoma cylindrospora]
MEIPFPNHLLPVVSLTRNLVQDDSDADDALPTSLAVAQNSWTAVSDLLSPSVSPNPTSSTYTLARKRKLDQTEHGSEDDLRSRGASQSNICNKCRQIDLNKVIGLGPKNQGIMGIDIQKVGRRFRQRIPTDCPLCQILFDSYFFGSADTKGRREDGDDVLIALNFLGAINVIEPNAPRFKNYQEANPLQCLVVVPSGLEYNLQYWGDLRSHLQEHGCSVFYHEHDPMPEVFAVQNVPSRFDSSVVVSWLQYCRRNHKKLCSKSRTFVDGLKLIDCESLAIKSANPKDVYVALSYVWGPSDRNNAPGGAGDAIENGRLPQVLPAVLSDAIKVTKLLGFRYLWIDKFCIDQADQTQKHDQIKQMGFVYENAELAIIAAAGLDENYGLPGVGATPRKAQNAAEIGNIRALSSMRHPHSFIRSSKWSTRGWTFQEAMLSRRRLVFTDEQVYFECNAMNCYESVTIPLNELHIKSKSKQRSWFRAGVFGRNGKETFGGVDLNTQTLYRVFVRYLAAIDEYSGRELRYDLDSLDALIGVTRKFEEVRHPYLHIWGIPYPSSLGFREVCNYLVDGLSWVHTRDCWDSTAAPRRRAGFPSWSWAGWAGKVSFPLHTGSGDDKLWFDSAIQAVTFEDESGRILGFAQIAGRISVETSQSSPQVLILKAPILPSSAFSYDPETNQWTIFNEPAQLNLSQGPTSPSDFYRELQQGGRWQCILTGTWLRSTFIMVLQSRGSIMSRAGIFQITTPTWDLRKVWDYDTVKKTTFRID